MRKAALLVGLLLAQVSFAQSTVTLNGNTYTLLGHPRVYFDGPSGTITTGITGSGSTPAPKAVNTNPPWVALGTEIACCSFLTNYQNAAYQSTYSGSYQYGWITSNWAQACVASPTANASYCTAALYMLNNIQQYVPFYCDETVGNCVNGGNTGYYVTSYGIWEWLPQWGLESRSRSPHYTGLLPRLWCLAGNL